MKITEYPPNICPQGSPVSPAETHRFKAFPRGAQRGGVKHRKNSPQVTVFSQSGEVAMLRAGRWHEVSDEGSFKCEINGKRIRAKRPMRISSSLLRKKEADETSASVNRCPVCPNPTRRVENQAYVYEFCRDFADIVLLVESYLITPSLMVREKRSLRPRRISSGITRALCPSAST